jgi:hypothetical protein
MGSPEERLSKTGGHSSRRRRGSAPPGALLAGALACRAPLFIVADFPVSPYGRSSCPSPQILVTSALPYANGSIHLGHMLEYIQTDIWVRFQKMRGNQALRLRRRRPRLGHHAARRKEGITPEQLIANVQAEHRPTSPTSWWTSTTTTPPTPKKTASCRAIYLKLRDAGHIATRP